MKPTLSESVGQTFILAYRENTDQLTAALSAENLNVQTLRQTDQPEYQGYSNIYRCLLNHHHAWQLAAQSDRPTMIVEADFVPIRGIGRRPLPFDSQDPIVGLTWLYTCAPQIYHVTAEGYAEGFSTSLVAYIITPQVAHHLLDLVPHITENHGTAYYNFDSDIDKFLRQRGFKNYLPPRNYGEHGGRPNPEHRRSGMSGIHHADILDGTLAFTPQYVTQTSPLSLLQARTIARLKGIARLLTGRYLRPYVLFTSRYPHRLLHFAITRHLTPHW